MSSKVITKKIKNNNTNKVKSSKPTSSKSTSSKKQLIDISDSDSEIELEEKMSDKPKPMTLKFRRKNAGKELEFFLLIIRGLADNLAIDGQDRDEALNTFISPFTDDDYKTLEAQLRKCKNSERKKKDKFIPKDSNGKRLKNVPSAYLLFCREEREKITANNPNISNAEKLSLLGESWTKLVKSNKSADKKRHQKYINLNIKLREERQKLVKSLKKEAIENGEFEEPKPKRPMSAYFIFIHSDKMKKEVIDKKIKSTEISKYKSIQWAKLSDNDKKPYFEQAEIAKKNFEEEIIKWQKRCAKRKKSEQENNSDEENLSQEQDNNSENELDNESNNESDNESDNEEDEINNYSDED